MHDLFYREDVFQDYDHGDKRRRGVDFTIDYQGRWYFHGLQSPGPIKRKALAGLFGGAGDGFMAGKGLYRDEIFILYYCFYSLFYVILIYT